jgi:hypothetical protein
MDSEGRLQFSKLSSVNYRQWSFTIKAVLASKDLIQYINNKVNDLIDDKAYDSEGASTSLATSAITTKTVDDVVAVAKTKKELQLSDAKA